MPALGAEICSFVLFACPNAQKLIIWDVDFQNYEKTHTVEDITNQVINNLRSGDWLDSYKEMSEIDNALKRISARIKWTNNLAHGIEDLTVNYQQLESDFRAFFPDLINYAATCKNQYQKYQH